MLIILYSVRLKMKPNK